MSLVGIPEEEQLAVCRTVAAILHLGNVAFTEGPEESSRLAGGGSAERHLSAVAALLGVQAQGLLHALTTRTRQTTDGAQSAHACARCSTRQPCLILSSKLTLA